MINLREAVIHLSGIVNEEDEDEFIDDYEELPKPKDLKIDGKGNVLWKSEMVGMAPPKGEVRFFCKKDCPKEVIDYFKNSKYKIIYSDDRSTWY